VGIHVVEEEEEAGGGVALQPVEGHPVHHLRGLVEVSRAQARLQAEPDLPGELVEDQLGRGLPGTRQVVWPQVVVLVVALLEAEALGQVDVGDDAAGGVAALLQHLREQVDLLGEDGGLGDGAVGAGDRGGEQAGGGGLRPRGVAEAQVAGPVRLGERAQVGRLDRGVPVAGEVVGPQRVHHDEDQVGLVRDVCGHARGRGRTLLRGHLDPGPEEAQQDHQGQGPQRRHRPEEPTQGRGHEAPPAEEEQQGQDRRRPEHPQQHGQRRHLLVVDVAPQAEEGDEEPEGDQGPEQPEGRRPALGLAAPHGQHAQRRAPQGGEAAQHRGVGQGPVPEHLGLGAEAPRPDHQRLGHAQHDPRDDAGGQAQAGVVHHPCGQGRELLVVCCRPPALALLGQLQGQRRLRRLGVVHLAAVHPAVARAVVGAADHPEEEPEERRHLAHPEAEGGREDGDPRPDDRAQGEQLRRLAHPEPPDGGPDHRGEDLDGGAEHDGPELGLGPRPHRQGHEVVHGGGGEVGQEAADEHPHHQELLVPVGRRGVGEPDHQALEPCLARQREPLEHPLHDPREEEHHQQAADHARRDGHGDRRHRARVGPEDLVAEGKRHQEGEEDAGDAQHFLQHGARGDLHRAAAEACGVVELVGVEARGAGQEEADGPADQKGPEHVAEGERDALAQQHQVPAHHRGEHTEEADRRPDQGEEQEGSGVDLLEDVEHQPPGRHHLIGLGGHGPGQEQPDHAHGQVELEHVEQAGAPGRGSEAARGQGQQRHGDQLENDHAVGPPEIALGRRGTAPDSREPGRIGEAVAGGTACASRAGPRWQARAGGAASGWGTWPGRPLGRCQRPGPRRRGRRPRPSALRVLYPGP